VEEVWGNTKNSMLAHLLDLASHIGAAAKDHRHGHTLLSHYVRLFSLLLNHLSAKLERLDQI
jgi:hypothetical protein